MARPPFAKRNGRHGRYFGRGQLAQPAGTGVNGDSFHAVVHSDSSPLPSGGESSPVPRKITTIKETFRSGFPVGARPGRWRQAGPGASFSRPRTRARFAPARGLFAADRSVAYRRAANKYACEKSVPSSFAPRRLARVGWNTEVGAAQVGAVESRAAEIALRQVRAARSAPARSQRWNSAFSRSAPASRASRKLLRTQTSFCRTASSITAERGPGRFR